MKKINHKKANIDFILRCFFVMFISTFASAQSSWKLKRSIDYLPTPYSYTREYDPGKESAVFSNDLKIMVVLQKNAYEYDFVYCYNIEKKIIINIIELGKSDIINSFPKRRKILTNKHIIAISPNGELLAVGDIVDKTINIYNISDKKLVKSIKIKLAGITALNFDTSGKNILYSPMEQNTDEKKGHISQIVSLTYEISQKEDNEPKITTLDVNDAMEAYNYINFISFKKDSIVYIKDNSIIITASTGDNTSRKIPSPFFKGCKEMQPCLQPRAVSISSHNNLLYPKYAGNYIEILDLHKGTIVDSLPGTKSQIIGLSYSKDNTHIVLMDRTTLYIFKKNLTERENNNQDDWIEKVIDSKDKKYLETSNDLWFKSDDGKKAFSLYEKALTEQDPERKIKILNEVYKINPVMAYSYFYETKNSSVTIEHEFNIYLLRAVAYMKKGDFHKALIDFKELEKYNYSKNDINTRIAECYININDSENALKYFNQAIAISTGDQLSAKYYNRGVFQSDNGNYNEALKDFDSAYNAEYDPHTQEIRSLLNSTNFIDNILLKRADTYFKLKKYDQAKRDYNSIINREKIVYTNKNREKYNSFVSKENLSRAKLGITTLELEEAKQKSLSDSLISSRLTNKLQNLNTILNRPGKDYALIIATDKYSNGWKPLNNPVSDAVSLKEKLENDYGFNVELDTNVSHSSVVSKIRQYIQKKFKDTDQLLIYISGHGYYDEINQTGYFVSKDSQLKDTISFENYYSFNDLSQQVNQIKVKHLLLLMDVCYGGTFCGTQTLSKSNDDPIYKTISSKEYVERKLNVPIRRFISSTQKQPTSDGRKGYHSPFAKLFLEALNSYKDLRDGILSYGELVPFFDKSKSLTQKCALANDNLDGDFLFISK